MRVSVIVPVRDSSVVPRCVPFVLASKYPADLVEIIVVAGDSPSAQRNLAVRNAQGEILYFIDDDSMIDARSIQHVVEAFEDHPEVVGVGGPSLGDTAGTLFQKCATMAMGSLFGFGPARHRYYPTGIPRVGGENELILSNLALRKEVWHQCEGFDTRLYPNEENEFIRRLEKNGHRFLYHPGALVTRPARETLFDLAYQVFRYGKSRAKHMRIAGSALNVLLLLPSAMVCYALCSFLGIAYLLLQPSSLHHSVAIAALALPIACYVALAILAALYAALSVRRKRVRTFLWLLAIFPTIHFGYGVGWIRGCFGTTLPKEAGQMHIQHISFTPA